MNSSRDKIFNILSKAPTPFTEIESPSEYLPVVPVDDHQPEALKARFVAEAEKQACVVHQVADDLEAVEAILSILGDAKNISAWHFENIPLPTLGQALEEAGITIGDHDDPEVSFGITGAQAALAATGSLVLESGAGQFRAPSILPRTHIAIVKESQITASLESWLAEQRRLGLENFRKASNIVLVTGPSRTADIAMELVMGMHGPMALHIILL